MPFDPSTAKPILTPDVQVKIDSGPAKGFDPTSARLSSTVQQEKLENTTFTTDPMSGATFASEPEAQSSIANAQARTGLSLIDPTLSMAASVPQIAHEALQTVGVADPYWLQKVNEQYPKFKARRKDLGSDSISNAAEVVGEILPLAFTGYVAGAGKLFGTTVKLLPRFLGNATAGGASAALRYKDPDEGTSRAFDTALGAVTGGVVPEAIRVPVNRLVASGAIKGVMEIAKSLAQGFDANSSKVVTGLQRKFARTEADLKSQFKTIIDSGVKFLKPQDQLKFYQSLGTIKPDETEKTAALIKETFKGVKTLPSQLKRTVTTALNKFEAEFAPMAGDDMMAKGQPTEKIMNKVIKIASGEDEKAATKLYNFAPAPLRDSIQRGVLNQALAKATNARGIDAARFKEALDTPATKVFLKGSQGENIINNLESLIETVGDKGSKSAVGKFTSRHPYFTYHLARHLLRGLGVGGGAAIGYHTLGPDGAVIGFLAAQQALHGMLNTDWGMRLLASTTKIKPNSPEAQRLVTAILGRTASTVGRGASAGAAVISQSSGNGSLQ